jgi:uncharacterized membrane protein YkoI
MKKATIVVSVVITVMVLTLIGGISTVLSKGTPVSATTTDQTAAYYATREAQYQQLLAQANQTIAQANQEIASLQGQTQVQAAPTATPYPILPDQAIAIAVNVTAETAQGAPTLVNYQGKVAYEVVFPSGKVYIDANTGKVLFNGVVASRMITSQQAAQIAANYTGNTQVIEVVSGLYNSASAFRVTFQNGEIVYVDVYGTILAVQLPPASSSGSSSEQENDD